MSLFNLDDPNRAASIALISESESLTYEMLIDRADMLGQNLKQRSVILFFARNTIDAIVGYVSCLRRGSVPLMVNSDVPRETWLALIEDYKPEYAFGPSELTLPFKNLFSEGSYTLWEVDTSSNIPINDNLALLLTTSGSTGSRKYVRLTLDNIVSNAASIAEYLGILRSDRAITTLPLSYSYGLYIVNSHLLAGASLVLTERTLFDRDFWSLLNKTNTTTFGGVPYTYQMLDRLHFSRMDTPSLRYITQAGGRLGADLQAKFASVCEQKGIDFVIMYGQTEATARLSYLPPRYAGTKLESIGCPIPGGRFTLMNDSGIEQSAIGAKGELIYYGPNVSLGYAQCRKDLAKDDERNGRLETGDIAERQEDGFYRIIGRKKRFLKVFGNRVNLDELESLLNASGYTVACGGSDDAVLVLVELGDVEEVREKLSELTHLNDHAFRIRSVEKIPRNDSGKILYANLEAYA